MILVVAVVFAGGGRDVALAAEAAADIGGKLAGGDDPIAVIVGLAREARAQEIGQEAAGLEAAGDEAGQILLRAEQAHHVRPVDEVAEAAGEAGVERDHRQAGMDAREERRDLRVGHRRIVEFDRLGAPVELGGADRNVNLITMTREEEQKNVVRPGRGGGLGKGLGDVLAGGVGVGRGHGSPDEAGRRSAGCCRAPARRRRCWADSECARHNRRRRPAMRSTRAPPCTRTWRGSPALVARLRRYSPAASGR